MKNIFKKFTAYALILCELFQVVGVYALTKDENVYVKLNEKGVVQSSSITEHLFDYTGNIINDKTILSSIENINGNEKFNQKGNDLIWETNGNDIYYKGSYNKDLPISIDVKYYLNGEEKTINEMLGKKGNVKISLTYKNHLYKNMNVNGKTEKIFVPYAIVTTTILNNDNNKNIKVTNGKIIDNGVSSVIMAVSSPGLYESLKFNSLKNINKVEITYDTKSFELNSIYSVATTSLFDDSSLDMFSKINNLYKSINLLQSNMDTIVEASKKLSDGTSRIDAGITELNTRIQELTKKYQYYRNQDRNTLKEELIKIVENNINTIAPALEEEITNEISKLIKENKEVVEEEVNKIITELDIDKLIEKAINSNLYSLLKNNSEITELTAMLKEDINNELNGIVLNEFNKLNNILGNNMSEIQNEDVNYLVENYGLTEEQAKEIVNKVQTDTLNQVKKNVSDTNITDKIINELNDKNYVSNLINNYVTKLNNKLSEYLNKDTTISEYSKEIKDKIILSIKKDLEEVNLYLNKNIKSYISELVDKIIDKQFSEESIDSKLRKLLDIFKDEINQKVTSLDATINTLSDSLNKLNNGSNQISTGMKALSDGLDKYNREGINKINSLVNGDVKALQKRLDALIKLSKDNRTIDKTPLDASNSSKIIFMIDSISKTKDIKFNEAIEETKSSIWDKIKGLF